MIPEFSIPGIDGTFFLADKEAALRALPGVTRGRIFAPAEVEHLKRAHLDPDERRKIVEIKLLFAGVVVGSSESVPIEVPPRWEMPTKRQPKRQPKVSRGRYGRRAA